MAARREGGGGRQRGERTWEGSRVHRLAVVCRARRAASSAARGREGRAGRRRITQRGEVAMRRFWMDPKVPTWLLAGIGAVLGAVVGLSVGLSLTGGVL